MILTGKDIRLYEKSNIFGFIIVLVQSNRKYHALCEICKTKYEIAEEEKLL